MRYKALNYGLLILIIKHTTFLLSLRESTNYEHTSIHAATRVGEQPYARLGHFIEHRWYPYFGGSSGAAGQQRRAIGGVGYL